MALSRRLLPIASALMAATPAVASSPAAEPVPTNPDVSFQTSSTSALESSGTVTVTVLLSAAAAQDVTVPFSVGGSADAADATVSGSPLVILAGQTSGAIDVTIVDDAVSEGVERVVLSLGTPTGAVLGATTDHEVVIDDDEPAATLSFDVAASSVSEGAGATAIGLTLSDARTEDVVLDFSTTGTATAGGVDVTLTPSAQLVIPGSIEEGHPQKDPTVLAETLWSMHTGRDEFRVFATEMDDEVRETAT